MYIRWQLPVLGVLAFAVFTSSEISGVAEAPRFHAPVNERELAEHMEGLCRRVDPYLRSLPTPLSAPNRTMVAREWKFAFESKETPKQEGVPPAPMCYGADFNDSKWETTTVPEWRYRTREGDDAALEPEKLAVWRKIAAPADTICWYRTAFRAPQAAPEQRQWLCFDGVDWEAQVYLNGELLGTHRVYFEPFRFDVTGKLKENNTLAVRVIAGPAYGEPVAYWGMFPDIRAAKQRYTPDRALSIPGHLPIGYHSGCGFGIFRNVYVEQTGPVRIEAIFARNDLSEGKVRVKVEFDGQPPDVRIELLPENFNGRSYAKTAHCDSRSLAVEIPMPDAKNWSPETPFLYRCRVTVNGSDAKDALFGCRSFSLKADGKQPGMFVLNGQPVFLRGSNIQGLNAYSYWGQTNELLRALLLLKAGNFNAVRSCQHVEFPEVRELMDRVGILSEQDQGGGRAINDLSRPQSIYAATVLARQTYNNPGVVLLSFVNEREYDTTPVVQAALAVDPQRICKPISGRFTASKREWGLPRDLRNNAVDDGHPYTAWYGKITPQSWNNLVIYRLNSPVTLGGSYGTVRIADRMVTLGEFGAEALDSYPTMRDHYPPQFRPPAPDTDTLWAASQVEKHDLKQVTGLGRDPKDLGEYIEASQNYQESVIADQTIGMRLSPEAISGYFHFHFLDVIPAFWPKSIVSFDHTPKKAYYQLAQINQPLVALPQLLGEKPDAMRLWIANDLAEPFSNCNLTWGISRGGQRLRDGRQKLDVPALGAVAGEQVDLSAIAAKYSTFDVLLTVSDERDRPLSRYQRTIRAVPADLLKSARSSTTEDPFNQQKGEPKK